MGVSTHILIARRERERAADEAVRAAERAATTTETTDPRADPEALPDGYTLSGGEGGYWALYRPDGVIVPGPSNGKWQGRDGAADAAWLDVAGR